MLFASSLTGAFHNEVCVCFGEVLLRGCRATKLRALDLRAFDSPNFPPLAKLGVRIELRTELARPPALGPLIVHTAMDTRILVIKLVPGFDDAALLRICEDPLGLKVAAHARPVARSPRGCGRTDGRTEWAGGEPLCSAGCGSARRSVRSRRLARLPRLPCICTLAIEAPIAPSPTVCSSPRRSSSSFTASAPRPPAAPAF